MTENAASPNSARTRRRQSRFGPRIAEDQLISGCGQDSSCDDSPLQTVPSEVGSECLDQAPVLWHLDDPEELALAQRRGLVKKVCCAVENALAQLDDERDQEIREEAVRLYDAHVKSGGSVEPRVAFGAVRSQLVADSSDSDYSAKAWEMMTDPVWMESIVGDEIRLVKAEVKRARINREGRSERSLMDIRTESPEVKETGSVRRESSPSGVASMSGSPSNDASSCAS